MSNIYYMKEKRKILINDKWLKQICTQYPEKMQKSVMSLLLRDTMSCITVCKRCKQAISRRNKSGYCGICRYATINREHIPSKNTLEDDSGLTVVQMAKKYKVSPGTISQWLKIRDMRRNRKV